MLRALSPRRISEHARIVAQAMLGAMARVPGALLAWVRSRLGLAALSVTRTLLGRMGRAAHVVTATHTERRQDLVCELWGWHGRYRWRLCGLWRGSGAECRPYGVRGVRSGIRWFEWRVRACVLLARSLTSARRCV